MQNFTARKHRIVILLALFISLCFQGMAQKAEVDVQEEANILFDEAIELKKQGNLEQAIEAYHKAMRRDRSILAFDDQGLIEDLRKAYEKKLEDDEDNIKAVETLAFVYAVCYSDYDSAIKCYEKVVQLTDDDKVKDNTNTLIERLRQTADMQREYQTEVAQSMREERLKTWSEMEKIDRLGQAADEMKTKSDRLAEMYRQKDSLTNRVPQLEEELKELQAEYDKANRLWFSLKDDLYYRRRRRLDDDIEEKKQELEQARAELEEAESAVSSLEKEVEVVKEELENSPVQTSGSYDGSTSDTDYGSQTQEQTNVQQPDEDSPENVDQEPLPSLPNPDFPEEESPEERERRLQELINSL
jgi:tetratricopeptide (TPR) repeat protein